MTTPDIEKHCKCRRYEPDESTRYADVMTGGDGLGWIITENCPRHQNTPKERKTAMIPYDPKCKDLAAHFLGGLASRELVSDLASQIQTTVENWIESRAAWTLRELQRGRNERSEDKKV